MKRVNYREIKDRFGHLDAEFVWCHLGFGAAEPRYVVRLYPWWEHPNVRKAIAAGKGWTGPGHPAGALKEVAVCPIGLRESLVSERAEVRNWEFCESHPLLWAYEIQGSIYCNSDFDMAELIRRVLAAGLPHATAQDIYRYLDPLWPYRAPFGLARLPYTLFTAARKALSEMGVRTYVPREVEAEPCPVLLWIDQSDYIIANDFELDVPKFKHKRRWYGVEP